MVKTTPGGYVGQPIDDQPSAGICAGCEEGIKITIPSGMDFALALFRSVHIIGLHASEPAPACLVNITTSWLTNTSLPLVSAKEKLIVSLPLISAAIKSGRGAPPLLHSFTVNRT